MTEQQKITLDRWKDLKRIMRKLTVILLSFLLCSGIIQVGAVSAKNVTLKMSNGAVYVGETKNGKPHGRGTMKYSKNKIYQGDWKNGKREGVGKITNIISEKTLAEETGYQTTTNEVTTYSGNWVNDQYSGNGVFVNKWKFREFNYSEEDGKYIETYEDYSSEVEKGVFKKGELSSGYSGSFSPNQSTVAYHDNQVSIDIGTQNRHGRGIPDKIGNLNEEELISSKIPAVWFSYDKKEKQGLQSIYLQSDIVKIGIFDLKETDKILNGMITERSEDETIPGYIRNKYVKANIVEGEVLEMDQFDAYWIDSAILFMKTIQQYAKGLNEVNNLLTTELNKI